MKKTMKFLSLVFICMVIAVATILTSSAKGNRDWKWPVPASNSISSCYLDGRAHYALDIPAGQGASIYASYSGTVIATYTGCSHNYGKNSSCGCGGGLGNYVYIKHTYQGTNYVSRYGHMTAVKVSVGASVTKNTIIGTVGTTGYSTGNHLDFRIYKGSSTSHTASTSAIDPFKEQFLEMPSGFRSTATTSCCGTYVNEVKSIYSTSTTPQQPTKILYPTSGSVYKIASAVGSDKYLDFALSSNNVQIYQNCDNHSDPAFVKSQYYKLTHAGDGWYTIVNTGNGKAVDVIGANSASGTNIQQHVINNTNAQLFRFYDAGNGYYYIKSKVGTYVDAEGGTNANNVNVWAYEFNGTVAQKWKLQSHTHSYTTKVTANATCTKAGSKTNTCKCGVTTTETIAKKGHSYTSTVTTQPTCAKEGVKTYKCTCGASYTEKIAKKSHSYTSTVTTQPTCAKEGVKTYKCTCGASYTQAIAKVAHSYTVTDVKASKDQPAGKKFTCKVCGYSYFQKLEKTWSEWSTTYPTGVDAKYIESKKEYRYSDYQTTTSYNSSVSGYTYLKSTWEKEGSYVRKYVPSWPSGYPTTSKFYEEYNKSKVNSSETSTTKIVANEPKVYGYIYYHWCRGTYTGGPINRTTKKVKTGEFCKWHAFTTSVNPNTLTCADDGSRIIGRENLCKDTYWYYPITINSQTYTKYKKLNTFYRWTDYSSWSSTAYTASSTRKVETRTLYRYVTFDPDAYVEEAKPLGTTSKISASKTSSSVTLNWNAVEGASGYRVFQKVDGKWKTLTNTTKLTYTINNLKANTKYNFAIRAYVLDGNEKVMAPKYKSISVTTSKASSSKPGQVKNVKATPTATTVKLTWSKVSGVKGYYVFSYNSKTKKYTSLGKTTGTSYTVKNRKANTAYQYAVQAYKVSGGKNVFGKVSSVVKVTTLLATPTVKISSTKGKANLTWNDIAGESGYAIYMATSKNGKYTHLANYKANSTKATKSNLKSGKTYYFKIRAYKKNSSGTVYGAYSAVKSIKIK